MTDGGKPPLSKTYLSVETRPHTALIHQIMSDIAMVCLVQSKKKVQRSKSWSCIHSFVSCVVRVQAAGVLILDT